MRTIHAVMPRAARAAAIALALAGCRSDQRQSRDTAAGGTDSAAAVQRGPARSASLRPFTGDVQVARLGRQHFLEYNCYGCHGGLAGGGMGPSLRDTVWRYGGTDAAILATLQQGRPGGMPKFAGIVPDTAMRQILAYIRSLRTEAEPTFFFSVNDTTTHAGTLER